jgi:HAD superfamily hydrolase (TIGR01509 family)
LGRSPLNQDRKRQDQARSGVSAVIFDCDGVLLDSEYMMCRLWCGALRELGAVVSEEEWLTRITGLSKPSWRRVLREELGVTIPEEMLALIDARESEALTEVTPVPGMLELVAAMEASVAVASSSGLARLERTLGATGFLPYFRRHVYSAEEVKLGKPAPDLFLHAAEGLGVEPEGCVVIEDAVPGVVAARTAGMRVIGFAGGAHMVPAARARLAAANPDAMAADAAALRALLGAAAS